MKPMWRLSLLSVAFVVLTGCTSVTGRWTLDTIDPEGAREAFPLSSVTLHDDGTYVATMPRGEKMVSSQGEYTFEKSKLHFVNERGDERTYTAKLVALGSKMEVHSEMDGEPVTAVMKRSKCEGCQKCKKHDGHETHEGHE